MTKRKYRVFGFESDDMRNKGRPMFGTTVLAITPENAIEYTIKNRRGAKNITYWGVCSLRNFIKIWAGGYFEGQIRVKCE